MALSVSLIIPCRNEAGNIDRILPALPQFPGEVEVVFVEGHSTDDTWQKLSVLPAKYPDLQIKVLRQQGKGKADAVHEGFRAAAHDVLIIFDADMTADPAPLLACYSLIASLQADVVIGSRFGLPMEQGAMPLPNRIANRIFALLLGVALQQRFTDTLCGTKAILRVHHHRILEASSILAKRDPFGDYWILAGAARAGLRIAEVPMRYSRRQYGKSNIRHVREGLLLLLLTLIAAFLPKRTAH